MTATDDGETTPRPGAMTSYVTVPMGLRVLECWNLETGEHGVVVTYPISRAVLEASGNTKTRNGPTT